MAMHGFSIHGTGPGAGPVLYFTDDHYFDKEEERWSPRDPLPEVLEGNPQLMTQMIDSLDQKHKYTSGVLSFTHADTEKLKLSGLSEAIVDINGRLKEMLFSGISPEHQHILIVAQTHLDRLELHYVLPRHNYEVGKAWNPAPPGEAKHQQMDALMDFINVKYGLDDPRDPLRARTVKDPQWMPSNQKLLRDTLNDFFKEAVIDGAINNRQELIDLAKKSGFEITRVGNDYVSMKPLGEEKAIRLKGEIYDKQFTSRTELTDTKTKSAERAAYLAKPAVAERYKQALRERKGFIEKRFEKALRVVRAGKNHSEIQKYNNTKRGDIVEISKSDAGNFADKRSNSLANNNNKVGKNDGFGKETNAVIARAERAINNTKQSVNRASRIVAAGSAIVKSAPERIGTPSLGIPMAPSDGADIGGSSGSMDSGDAEADKVINKKRSEFGALNNKLRQIEAANKQGNSSYSPT